MAGRNKNGVLEQYRASLRTSGGWLTRQRRMVLSEVVSMGPHFDVRQLTARMAQKYPRVSRATIYRTVAHLERLGILRRAVFGESHAHFESMVGALQHGHLLCRNCDRIIEFEDRLIKQKLLAVSRRYGFRPDSQIVIEVRGLCKECSQRDQFRPS